MRTTPVGTPFRQFIVKLHSRCNLSCRYCYVYHHVDQSWRTRPNVMSPKTVAALAMRIGEHARRHGLPELLVVLHGGEPLLAGPDVIDAAVGAIRRAVPASTRVDVTLQTNGTLLDDRFLKVFHRREIGVGVSVDGGSVAHDRHRRFADGRPSFHLVRRALRTLNQPEHRDLYAGLLCTIDLANDPVGVYEDLLEFDPPQLDLLLPLGNWVHPPPGREPGAAGTPYADWLIPIFDRWFAAPRRETAIRLFESLITLLVGGESHTEGLGFNSPDAITVETDGALELTDALKTTAQGKGATGYNVQRDGFDVLVDHPGVRALRRLWGDLAPACRACPVGSVCGGGQFSHRYGPDGGFRHPSVYCADLFKLVGHVRKRLEAELAVRRLAASA
ncbi:FxsB family cyclophane-forming radical SAM/SPASM peptide maturase [Phytohabitans sp. LJ34]|uniref:FxsB family cyclophane-forming radical SAM/SPASM peptide maturase n=1 Tax=Phytohabitans sp. LJ34 TaxID=3452217 RepID=UPI003F8CB4D6